MKKLILSAAIFLPLLATAQPVLVQDILPGVFSSHPSRLTVFSYNLYFFADDDVNGMELWQHDGTNTKIKTDIYPGPTFSGENSITGRMAVLGNKLYFPADDSIHGMELYSYDGGTTTALVSDIAGGQNGSHINELIAAANGKLYFDANNGTNGQELWEYNPVKNATEQLTFINTGTGCNPDQITEVNGKIYFTAETPADGRELYEYDPATGMVKLISIYPGSTGSAPMSLVNIFDTLYFNAATPDYGRELYKYDGTSVKRLTDLNPGTGDGLGVHAKGLATIGAAGSELFFAGDDGNTGIQLYKYDYIAAQASPVATINATGNSTPASFIYYANKLFFTADDGVHGRELWAMDIAGQPSMIADLNTNTAVDIEPTGLVIYNGSLYFTTYGDKGAELYKYTDAKASVENMNAGLDVQVFPNPAGATVFFKMELQQAAQLNIVITDASGRVVFNKGDTYTAGARTIPVPVSVFSSGMYFYAVYNTGGQLCASGRVVKM